MRDTESVLRGYLQRTLGVTEDSWTILSSSTGGRGVFATRDFQPGQVIFHDRPVVWGPRAKTAEPICASCHRRGRVSACVAGCYLPICSETCSASSQHLQECRIVRESMEFPKGSWRLDLVGSVLALRCLHLSPQDRQVVLSLQRNQGKPHGFEVDILKKHMRDKLDKEDEKLMRECCLAVDTNAYEFIKVLDDNSQTSLRGLYPLAAILNHECSPNTSHVYDRDGIMQVTAAKHIKAGDEITTCYTSLIWSTSIRRLNLLRSKQFACRCARCADPTEFGSFFSSLPCPRETCPGIILPTKPLTTASSWCCGTCHLEVAFKQAVLIQTAQAPVMQTISAADPSTLRDFLSTQVNRLHPSCQMVVQLKLDLIWRLGNKGGYSWPELPQDILELKQQFCKDILNVFELLRLGFCRMKGLILLELVHTLREKQKRGEHDADAKLKLEEEVQTALGAATLILRGDAAIKLD